MGKRMGKRGESDVTKGGKNRMWKGRLKTESGRFRLEA